MTHHDWHLKIESDLEMSVEDQEHAQAKKDAGAEELTKLEQSLWLKRERINP
jgi:hypothetical protein